MTEPVSIRDRISISVAFIEERAPYAVFTAPPAPDGFLLIDSGFFLLIDGSGGRLIVDDN